MKIEPLKRGVGRPRARDSEHVGDPRFAILQCASRLFSSNGYAGTTMQDIARAAGLRPSSIYYYFSGKDEIRSELVEQAMQQPLEVASALASSEGRGAVKLYRFLVFHIELLTAGPFNFLFFLREPPESYKAEHHIDARYTAWRRAAHRLVEAAVAAGDFAAIDAEFAVDMIQACMRGAQEVYHLKKPMAPHEVVAFIVRALAKDAAVAAEICAQGRAGTP